MLIVDALQEPSQRPSYKVVICIFCYGINLHILESKKKKPKKKNIKEFIQPAINAELSKADSYTTTSEVWLLQWKQLLHLMKTLQIFSLMRWNYSSAYSLHG